MLLPSPLRRKVAMSSSIFSRPPLRMRGPRARTPLQVRRDLSGVRLVSTGQESLTAEPGGALVAIVLYPGADPEDAATVRALLDRLTAAVPGLLAEPQPTGDGDSPSVLESPRTTSEPVLRIDARSRTVTRAGVEVKLCRREFDLLAYLAENPGQVFSRLQLLDAVWGDIFSGSRTVDVHVRRLRQKVGSARLVTTVRGIGYRLASDASVALLRGPTGVAQPTASESPNRPVQRWLSRQGAA